MMAEQNDITVRPINEDDAPFLVTYWCENEAEYMESMGVDVKKLPDPSGIEAMVMQQLNQPLEKKTSYALIAELNGQPIGHCNLNPIEQYFAFLHLHIWSADHRGRGLGQSMLKESLQHFFSELNISTILSEPYAKNPAPHAALKKAGFKHVKTYVTTPGHINFEQEVHRWQIEKEAVLSA